MGFILSGWGNCEGFKQSDILRNCLLAAEYSSHSLLEGDTKMPDARRCPGARYHLLCCCLITSKLVSFTTMDYSLPSPSVHGISQARSPGVACPCFSEGSLTHRGLNPWVLHTESSALLSHQGSPRCHLEGGKRVVSQTQERRWVRGHGRAVGDRCLRLGDQQRGGRVTGCIRLHGLAVWVDGGAGF